MGAGEPEIRAHGKRIEPVAGFGNNQGRIEGGGIPSAVFGRLPYMGKRPVAALLAVESVSCLAFPVRFNS